MVFKDWIRTSKCLHLQGRSEFSLVSRLRIQPEGVFYWRLFSNQFEDNSIYLSLCKGCLYKRTWFSFTQTIPSSILIDNACVIRNLRNIVINVNELRPSDILMVVYVIF